MAASGGATRRRTATGVREQAKMTPRVFQARGAREGWGSVLRRVLRNGLPLLIRTPFGDGDLQLDALVRRLRKHETLSAVVTEEFDVDDDELLARTFESCHWRRNPFAESHGNTPGFGWRQRSRPVHRESPPAPG